MPEYNAAFIFTAHQPFWVILNCVCHAHEEHHYASRQYFTEGQTWQEVYTTFQKRWSFQCVTGLKFQGWLVEEKGKKGTGKLCLFSGDENENQLCSMRELEYLKRGLLNENNGFDKNTLIFEIFLFNLKKILMPNHKFLQECFLKEQVCPTEGLSMKANSLMMD